MNTQPDTNPETLTVFYDNDCPVCRREVSWLQQRQPQSGIQYVDIDAVDPALAAGKSRQQLMRRLHARRPDGTWISGVDVLVAMYRSAGLGWLARLLSFPLFRPLAVAGYGLFAWLRPLLKSGNRNGGQSVQPGAASVPGRSK